MLEVSIEQIKKLLEQIKSNYNILLDELDSYSRNNIKIVKITSPSYSESVSIKNRIDYDVEITGEIYFNFTSFWRELGIKVKSSFLSHLSDFKTIFY